MNIDTDGFPCRDLPFFLNRAEELCQELQCKDYDELKKLWKCNDQIATLNVQRLKSMDLRRNLTPAVLAYEGIRYQHMAPGVFTDQELEYIQDHLRILSGFYGILKPFDGVVPYRLEMQARLSVRHTKNLYSYWDRIIADYLFAETACIVNLASKEYSLCVSPYLKEGVRFISCIFGEEIQGKIIEKGTLCKMARGAMVRYMAENRIEDPEQLKDFQQLNYCYDAERSDSSTFVFLKK